MVPVETIKSPQPSISDKGVLRRSDALGGKTIAIGICGGIGAVETVKLARELRRHGPDRVQAFFTPDAPKFISALSVEWATGLPVVESVGAQVDHLESFDLVIVAPATLNTISKCAWGMSDNAVTLLVASQIGRQMPVLLVPTMNRVLWQHPAYAEARHRLETWKVDFLETPFEEDRLKMPSPEALREKVIGIFGR
jgi:phosphopantothenoylcysteine decarboxylase/phosphopantothenate--cysteine ligase